MYDFKIKAVVDDEVFKEIGGISYSLDEITELKDEIVKEVLDTFKPEEPKARYQTITTKQKPYKHMFIDIYKYEDGRKIEMFTIIKEVKRYVKAW